MPHTDDEGELKPLVQPRVIRAIKDRPRVVDVGFRKEVLENIEQTVKQRRTTDTIASKISHNIADAMSRSAEPAVRQRLRNWLDITNETVARDL